MLPEVIHGYMPAYNLLASLNNWAGGSLLTNLLRAVSLGRVIMGRQYQLPTPAPLASAGVSNAVSAATMATAVFSWRLGKVPDTFQPNVSIRHPVERKVARKKKGNKEKRALLSKKSRQQILKKDGIVTP